MSDMPDFMIPQPTKPRLRLYSVLTLTSVWLSLISGCSDSGPRIARQNWINQSTISPSIGSGAELSCTSVDSAERAVAQLRDQTSHTLNPSTLLTQATAE